MNGNGIKHSIAIASGKGGVGKSTVSVNLAVALAQAGSATGLLDADIYGPSMPMMTGVHRMPRTNGGKMVPLDAHGLRLDVAGVSDARRDADGVARTRWWPGPSSSSCATSSGGLSTTWSSTCRPARATRSSLWRSPCPSPGAVIVMTPQDVAAQIACKAAAMFQQLKVPILGILENMSGSSVRIAGPAPPSSSRGAAAGRASYWACRCWAEIPLDPMVCQASDRGEPIATAHPGSPMAKAFRGAAEALVARIEAEATSGPVIRMGP